MLDDIVRFFLLLYLVADELERVKESLRKKGQLDLLQPYPSHASGA